MIRLYNYNRNPLIIIVTLLGSMAIKVLNIDLELGLMEIGGLELYDKVLVLWRWRGHSLGQSFVNIFNGKLNDLEALYIADFTIGEKLAKIALKEYLEMPNNQEPLSPENLTYSVIICTRNRASYLKDCLNSLCSCIKKDGEIIVVDNAPSDDQTAKISLGYPVRYVREGRIGLNWARSRGALEANGDILIFTDDDVIVDPYWINSMLQPFLDPEISAVTGLVMPFELETPAQERFDSLFAYKRSFERHDIYARSVIDVLVGYVGIGANMAFRRHVIKKLNLFDTEMDCGTAVYASGDTYAFHRLLSLGYRIVYNPNAVIWHKYRRDWNEMREQIYGYEVGAYSFLFRCLFLHRDITAIYAILLMLKWRVVDTIKLFRGSPDVIPMDLNIAKIKGALRAPIAYLVSRNMEKRNLKLDN
jgi:glycosyltransferase involved in cell wall biosynthesis